LPIIRKSKGFYAVFPTPDEYAVYFESQRIGTIPTVPKVNDFLLLAGKRWQVVAIEQEQLQIYVRPAMGRRTLSFNGCFGDVHPAIRRKMQRVFFSIDEYEYLDSTAKGLLANARSVSAASGISRHSLLPLGPRRTAWFTWTGSRIQATLQALLYEANQSPEDKGIALVFKRPIDEVRSMICSRRSVKEDATAIVQRMPPTNAAKYDWALDKDLIAEKNRRSLLDLQGAWDVLARFCS
jgi:ATP-dependent Lhr-like helicase